MVEPAVSFCCFVVTRVSYGWRSGSRSRREEPIDTDDAIDRHIGVARRSARGARRTCIGRNRRWHRPTAGVGLAAFGQPGVEAVIDILNRELATIMRQAGTPTIASITGAQVLRSGA